MGRLKSCRKDGSGIATCDGCQNRRMVTCAVCGRTEKELPPIWSSQVSERGQQWLCESCTRENLRSIEGRLDEAWW